MYISLASYYLICVPASVFLCFVGGSLGVVGLWLAYLLGTFVLAILYVRLVWFSVDWHHVAQEARERIENDTN